MKPKIKVFKDGASVLFEKENGWYCALRRGGDGEVIDKMRFDDRLEAQTHYRGCCEDAKAAEAAPRWLGVDVTTKTAAKLARRLKTLKSTTAVKGPYPYAADESHSMLQLQTSMTETELSDWLYNVEHGAEYLGTFDAEPPKAQEAACAPT